MLSPGQYLGEVGRYTEAADNYVRATQFTPEDFELIFNTANALRQANRNDEAEKFYKKAAKLRPNVSSIRHFHKLQELRYFLWQNDQVWLLLTFPFILNVSLQCLLCSLDHSLG